MNNTPEPRMTLMVSLPSHETFVALMHPDQPVVYRMAPVPHEDIPAGLDEAEQYLANRNPEDAEQEARDWNHRHYGMLDLSPDEDRVIVDYTFGDRWDGSLEHLLRDG